MRGASSGLIVLLAASAGAASLDVQRWRPSPRQAQLVMAARPGATASLRIEFRVGCADDGQRPGLTRVAQQAIVGGRRRTGYAQLQEALYTAGAELRLETGVRHSAFVLTAPKAAFHALAGQLLALCLDAAPDLRDLGAAQARARQDHEPGDASTFAAFLASVVTPLPEFGNRPYGSSDGIVALSWPELQAHLERYFVPANAIVTAAGDFSPAALRREVARHRGGRSRPTAERPAIRAGVFFIQSPLELYLYAFPATIDSPAAAATAQLLAALVGEGAQRAFRDRGVAYSVDTLLVQEEWLDALVVAVPRVDATSEQVGSVVQQQVDALTANGVDEATFERNRAYVLSRIEQDALRSDRLLASLEACGRGARWCSEDLAAQIRSLDRDAFVRLARPWVERRSRIDVTLAPFARAGLTAAGRP